MKHERSRVEKRKMSSCNPAHVHTHTHTQGVRTILVKPLRTYTLYYCKHSEMPNGKTKSPPIFTESHTVTLSTAS